MIPFRCAVLTTGFLFTVTSGAYAQRGETKTVSVADDVTLHYVEQGEGEPIIFIHGLTGDYSVWLRQVEAFADEGFRAISYSRRYNHPNENALQPNHSASVEARDLAAMIRKLELPKAHIVGHSYGAYTALLLALDHPQLVRTLTLAEPPLATWLSSLSGDQAEAAGQQSRKLFREGVLPARAAIQAGDDDLAMRSMLDAIGGQGTFERLPAPVRQRCMRNINELKAILTSENAYPHIDRERIRNLNVPTLLLSGSETVATAKYTDPELQRLLPERTSRRVILPGATHIMWVQQPVQSRQAVLEFIR